MAFIPVPNAVRVSMEFLIAGQVVVITLSFEKGSAPSTADLNDLATRVKDWWNLTLKPNFPVAIALTNVNVTDLSSVSAPSVNLAVSPVITGSQAGNPLGNSTAAVISFRTDNRGRSYRGRVYLPALSDFSQVSAVQFSNGQANAYILAFLALIANVSAVGWTHVVISRFTAGAARTTGVTTPITSYLVDTFYDSQRRRNARGSI